MFSIPGNTLTDVMRAITTDERYTPAEQTAARVIADETDRYESESATVDREERAWDEAQRAKGNLCAPCCLPPPARPRIFRFSEASDRFTVWAADHPEIRFAVRPYTTGQTMNVGIIGQ